MSINIQEELTLIRPIESNDEGERHLMRRRTLPAFAMSGLLHSVFMGLFVVLTMIFEDNSSPVAASPESFNTIVVEPEEEFVDLTNVDMGLDPDLHDDVQREVIENIESPVDLEEPIGVDAGDGVEIPRQSFTPRGALLPEPKVPFGNQSGAPVIGGPRIFGEGRSAYVSPGMRGRSSVLKDTLLRAGGGNKSSEAAVARGLAWLAKQQKFLNTSVGFWEYDGSSKNERVAATGMALMPFLAAGQTHKSGKYRKNVLSGIAFLTGDQKPDGSFKSTKNMYATGIGAMAMAEAYGMTRDPVLKRHAQAAMNFLVQSQASDGSWGYSPNVLGDTSIVGWQIQALKSGKLANLTVPDATIDRARAFLEKVSSDGGSQYGYRDAGSARPTLNAVGLLCRIYLDKWGPRSPSLAKGVENLLKQPPKQGRFDMYYYYYATQVVHFFGGPDWHKSWNPKMRDWLIELQEKKQGPDYGSWDKDAGTIGSHCGRLGTTCLSLLTLEVYYRYLPLYKRDTGGLTELNP